ncbi:MAG: lipoate--protein ligase family protein, partial [Longimicrobiales bacterium]
MAADAALLAGVRHGAPPALRLYRWSPPCLSLGRNQPAYGIYNVERARACGFDVVRRPTGGLAVLHDREVTYAVAAPAGEFGGLRYAYAALNGALVAGLRRLGVAAELAPAGSPATPLAAGLPCFASP